MAMTTPADSSTELGRETRAYVSGYDRTLAHESRLFPQERRQLVANFNGAMPADAKITRVTWDIQAPCAITMAVPVIDASRRSVRVAIVASQYGIDCVRCQVTLDNGGMLNQYFRVAVYDGPWFGETTPQPGPSHLEAVW
jgi:hypothetical protein